MQKLTYFLFFLLFLHTAHAQVLFSKSMMDSISTRACQYQLSKDIQPFIDTQQALHPSGAAAAIKAFSCIDNWRKDVIKPSLNKSTDTLFVGLTPGDSLFLTGVFANDGPVLVYGDGILVFDNAQALINGDIIVWGEAARLVIKNSTITSPQSYIYQRSMVAAGQAHIIIENAILNYSGLSHNLVITDSASINWINVEKYGFTTCGLWNKGEIDINGTPQAGEFIMTHQTKASFSHANTVLIWHHIPDTGVFNITFPAGDTVSSFQLNNTTPGVQGTYYQYTIDTCTDVMWGLMPEPGSHIHITNSELRTIGLWFKNQNNFQVSGLVNSSQYTNFTAPLNDRVLILENTFVRTWSLYVFENAQGNIDNCIVGEIGVFENADVEVDNSLIDGSGGFFFSEGISKIINGFSFLNCDFQSKDNSFAFQVYGGQNWGRCIALDKSIMFVIQSNLPDIPEIYNDAMVWYIKLEGSSNIWSGSIHDILGSAWLNKASAFYPHEFSHYEVSYKHPDSTNWLPICGPVYNEVYSNVLCTWNTTGIMPGNYLLRLCMWDNTPDSNMVEAIRLYNLLLPTYTSNHADKENSFYVFPNPTKNQFTIKSETPVGKITIFDINGKELWCEHFTSPFTEKTIHINQMMHKSNVVIIRLEDIKGNVSIRRLAII